MKSNFKREALYWQKKDDKTVQCLLCPNLCVLKNNEYGSCKVRVNRNGTLEIPFYGAVSSLAVDPVEKKPLYHFHPGENILSLGTVGCSFHCIFCQNYSISQYTDIHTEYLSKEEVYNILKSKNLKLLAFTYSEPLVWYEYILDVSKYIKKKDSSIKIVLVTNGYINLKPLGELIEFIDAANVDLKSYYNKFYTELCEGKVDPVKNFIKYVYNKIHLEVTTLVIPGYNDTEKEIEEISVFLSSLNENIPYHISKYFPAYKMSVPPTEDSKVKKLVKIAKKHLKYVYSGNIISNGSDTFCPYCGNLLIKRHGYFTKITGINYNPENNKYVCSKCLKEVDIVL